MPASGVPAGSGNYIQNSSSPQASSNFNISGDGTAAGTIAGNVVNATTQYNLNGLRILSNPVGGNLFAGDRAGAAHTTGGGNSFFGTSAGENATANENSFFGDNAGRRNTTGNGNSFFGQSNGSRNLSGNFNAFFGLETGVANTTGGANSFFGTFAGGGNQSGSFNTMIGFGANVFFGDLTNATAIGANARVDASNSLVLGSISGISATPDTNVGIGTTTPQRKMHIRGTGSGGVGVGDLLVTGTGPVGSAITLEATGSGGRSFSWISTASSASSGGGKLAAFDVPAGAYRMVIDFAGRVGIGTDTPDQVLSVGGNASKSAGGTSWAVFSDERLKNIKGPFTPGLKALSII